VQGGAIFDEFSTEEMLDRWLSNPEALIPGQEMDVRVRSAEERRLLIAYLKSQSTSTSPPTLTSKH
jgi:cytochrome c